MWDWFLELASGMAIPAPLLAVVAAILVAAYWQARRAEVRIPWWMLTASLAGLAFLSLAPIAASQYLETQGVYHLDIQVIGPDAHRVSDVVVNSSVGTPQPSGSSWKLAVPEQIRPADGRITISATANSASLAGSTVAVLGASYFPQATVQLTDLPSLKIHGTVVNRHGKPVAGAFVSIDTYPVFATTDSAGKFEISAHVSSEKTVRVIAQKGSNSAGRIGPANAEFAIMMPID